MSYGFQSVNADNIVQIDDAYRNLLRVASGSWTSGGAVVGEINFPTQTSTAPLIFFRPSADGVYVGQVGLGSDRVYFSTNGNFDWVVYGLDGPVMTSASNYGMQVFNASGQVVFDSRYEPPRIQTIVRHNQTWPTYANGGGSLGQNPNYPYTFNFTGWGERPWICLNSLFFWEDDNGTTTCATTSGTNAIILRCGSYSSVATGWYWYPNDGGAKSHPYGHVRIPLLRR